MKKYIFIHGACQGGWCWYKIEYLLKSNHIDYTTPDLPGHGNDQTPLYEITLEKYVASIRNIIKRTDKNIVLIGHSMGGFIASQVVEYEYKKIDKIIYIASLVPKHNETVLSLLKKDKKSKLMQNSIVSNDNIYVELESSKIDDILFNHCSSEDIEFGKSKLCKQAILPMNTPIVLTKKFKQIPKYYIKTLYDHSISIEFQNEICDRYNHIITKEIKSGHALYFSKFFELYDIIVNDNW